jgi:uncharacterized protein (TIGR00255 family)
MNQHEITFRNVLRERFSRGKFDVSISLSGAAAAGLKVNKEVAGKIFSALKSLQEDFAITGELDINGIAYFHDMFMESDVSYDVEEIRRVFEDAVDRLLSMRSREGQLLVAEVTRLIESLDVMNNEVKALSAMAAPEAAARLKERLTSMLDNQEIDPVRMHQEIALLAAKSDITEETARFDCHIRQFREILGSGDIIGRKLDFLVQELNREVNTMSSKSVDYRISRLTVDMKTEIEKIREQVQNLQ